MTPRLPSRPLLALVGLALLAPAAAGAADPSPVAAPSNPAPVAATPTQPATPPASSSPTTTRQTLTSTPPASSSTTTTHTVTPSGPTAAQRAAARRAQRKAQAHRAAIARKQRHQLQLLAAAQTHSEAVLRAELTAAKRTNAVDLLAGSVTGSIGAAPVERLPRASQAAPTSGSGGSSSLPLPALMLGACAALLGIAAAFASRRGIGLVTASLSLIVLLLAGI